MFTIHHLNIDNIRSVWGLRTLHPVLLAIITMHIQADFPRMAHLPILS
jgi:hypothetical protein